MNFKLKTFAFLLVLALFVAACAQTPVDTPTSEEPTKAAPAETEASEEPSESVSEEPAESLEPIKIGLSLVFTGPGASIGENYLWGMTLAAEDLGYEIAGRPIEIIQADNKCNPSDTVTAVQHLIDVEEVQVIIGSGCSSSTLASLPIILEGETPQLTVASSNPTIFDALGVGGNEWGFRMNIDDNIIAEAFAPYIAESNSSVFTIAQNNDYGRGAVARYLEELPPLGVEIVGEEYFEEGSPDFRPILTSVKEKDPDAIFLVMGVADSSNLMRQFRELGLEANVYSRGAIGPDFLELISDDPSIGEGMIDSSFAEAGVGMDTELEDRLEARWDSPPTTHRLVAYYGLYYVVADAIERAIAETGDATRESIRDALETTSVDTPMGPVAFDEHNQAYPDITITIIRDGKMVLLQRLPSK